MITLYKENGLTFANLADLHPWEKNPKDVDENDVLDLKRQIDLGQFKPLLVMVEDGTVLGGNTRSRVYEEKGIVRPWVSTIEFYQNPDTREYHALVNGIEAKRTFTELEQAMLEYSLADNDEKGKYNAQALAELSIPYQHMMPIEIYKVNLSYSVKMQGLLDSFQPTPELPSSSNPEDHWAEMPEFKHEDKSAYRQIIVSFMDEEAVTAFAELMGQVITNKTKSIWYPEQPRQSIDVVYKTDEVKVEEQENAA